jgi:hypothetical protein
MPMDVVIPEEFVNLTRAEVKRILHCYIEDRLHRDVRVVSLNTNVNGDTEILVTAYLKDRS